MTYTGAFEIEANDQGEFSATINAHSSKAQRINIDPMIGQAIVDLLSAAALDAGVEPYAQKVAR